jgi:hypothetical protein
MSIASVLMLVVKRARGTIAAILVLAVWVGTAPLLKAQDMEVPVTLHIPLFFKVMSFDRAFPARTGRSLVIAVVYQRGNHASIEARDEALRAIARTPRSADFVERRGIAVDLDSESLAGRLIRESADVVYITPLRSIDIRTIVAAAEAAGASTWTGVAGYMAQGVSVGVRLERDRPRIVINLDASHRQRIDFSSELLKLAEVI